MKKLNKTIVAICAIVMCLTLMFSVKPANAYEVQPCFYDHTTDVAELPATNNVGIDVVNDTGKLAIVNYEAIGEWSNYPSGSLTDADGYPDKDCSNCAWPSYYGDVHSGELILHEGYYPIAYGPYGSGIIEPGQTVNFVINDDPRYYGDNRGSQEIFCELVIF